MACVEASMMESARETTIANHEAPPRTGAIHVINGRSLKVHVDCARA
jgi:hypothetical protein